MDTPRHPPSEQSTQSNLSTPIQHSYSPTIPLPSGNSSASNIYATVKWETIPCLEDSPQSPFALAPVSGGGGVGRALECLPGMVMFQADRCVARYYFADYYVEIEGV